MHSTFLALLWQQWRQTRLYLFVVLVLVLNFLALEMSWGGLVEPPPPDWPIYLQSFLLFAFFLILLVSHCDPENIHPSIPSRVFVLPVPTYLLVTSYFIFRVAAVGIVSVPIAYNYCLLFDRPSVMYLLPLGAMALMAYFQSTFWLFARAGAIASLIAGCVLLCPIAALPLSISFTLAQHPAWTAAGAVVFILAAFVVSLVAARLERRSAWTGAWAVISALWDWRVGRQKPFASAAHAQRWFEWKRRGKLLPVLAAIAFVLLRNLPRILLPSPMHPRIPVYQDATFAASCTVLAAFVAALWFAAQDYRERTNGLSSFMMSRPMSTKNLGVARLRVGARSILVATAVMAVLLILRAATSGAFMSKILLFDAEAWFSVKRLAVVAGITLTAGLGWLALCWSLFWFSVPLLSGYGLIFAFVALVEIAITRGFGAPPASSPETWPLIFAVLLPGLIGLYTSYQRGLVSIRGLVCAVVLWPIAFLDLAALVFLAPGLFGPGWSTGDLALWGALCMLPGLAIATVPLKMQWLRVR